MIPFAVPGIQVMYFSEFLIIQSLKNWISYTHIRFLRRPYCFVTHKKISNQHFSQPKKIKMKLVTISLIVLLSVSVDGKITNIIFSFYSVTLSILRLFRTNGMYFLLVFCSSVELEGGVTLLKHKWWIYFRWILLPKAWCQYWRYT